MCKKIAADLGNGFIKAIGDECLEGLMFPACYSEVTEEEANEDSGRDGMGLIYNGKAYRIGTGSNTCTSVKKKVKDISTILFVLATIAKISKTYGGEVELMLGLPSRYYTNPQLVKALKDFVMKHLKDKTTFDFEGIRYTISIKNITVCMQGAVLTLAPQLFGGESENLIIDFGKGTIDTILFRGFKYNVEEVFTFEKGMEDFFDDLYQNINSNPLLDTNFKEVKDIENRVKKGKFIENQIEYSIYDMNNEYAKTVTKTVAEYLKEVILKIQKSYNTSSLSNIILTGGGAVFLKPYVESVLGKTVLIQPENTKVPADKIQQFANALNYYNILCANNKRA